MASFSVVEQRYINQSNGRPEVRTYIKTPKISKILSSPDYSRDVNKLAVSGHGRIIGAKSEYNRDRLEFSEENKRYTLTDKQNKSLLAATLEFFEELNCTDWFMKHTVAKGVTSCSVPQVAFSALYLSVLIKNQKLKVKRVDESTILSQLHKLMLLFFESNLTIFPYIQFPKDTAAAFKFMGLSYRVYQTNLPSGIQVNNVTIPISCVRSAPSLMMDGISDAFPVGDEVISSGGFTPSSFRPQRQRIQEEEEPEVYTPPPMRPSLPQRQKKEKSVKKQTPKTEEDFDSLNPDDQIPVSKPIERKENPIPTPVKKTNKKVKPIPKEPEDDEFADEDESLTEPAPIAMPSKTVNKVSAPIPDEPEDDDFADEDESTHEPTQDSDDDSSDAESDNEEFDFGVVAE